VNAVIGAEVAAYFATPELHADPMLSQTLIGEYARGLFEIAIEQGGPALAAFCPGAEKRASRSAWPWHAAWHPDLAVMERLMGFDPAALTAERMWDALAAVFVRLGAEGVLEEAEIAVTSPRPFFWGNLRLPVADRLLFHRAGTRAQIKLFRDGGQPTTLYAELGAHGLWQSDDAPSVGIAWLDSHPIFIWTLDDRAGYPHPGQRPPLLNALEIVPRAIAEAGELLRQNCPSFVPWIAAVMRHVVPLDGSDGVRMSASVEEFPALTFLSFPVPSVELAETLAHEASHHHFLALQRLTPLHDGSDTKLYHSPVKKTGRPIELILYAFHAFANAAIYHRNLVRNDHPEYYALNGRTLDESLARIRVMHEHIQETRALTSAGKTLWTPLAQALFEE
jgi:hypothetical protein